MLSALVVLGDVGQVAGSLIVAGKSERTVGGRVDLVAEGLEVDAIFGCFRDLCLLQVKFACFQACACTSTLTKLILHCIDEGSSGH